MQMLAPTRVGPEAGRIEFSAAKRDVDLIFWTLRLHRERRYFKQRFWENETRATEFASRVDGENRLESVSEHSWHVAYIASVLYDHFSDLDRSDCIELAIIHDLMELITGDKSPLGRDGTGKTSHIFNDHAAQQKLASEESAIAAYLQRLPDGLAARHKGLLHDYMYAVTREARFIKAIDKLQSLAFVAVAKQNSFGDRHLAFTLRYWRKGCKYFPELGSHFDIIWDRVVSRAAALRGIPVVQMNEIIRRNYLQSDNIPDEQLSLFDDIKPS